MEGVRGSGDGLDGRGQQVAAEVQSAQVSRPHLSSQGGIPMVLDGVISPESNDGHSEMVSISLVLTKALLLALALADGVGQRQLTCQAAA